MKKALKIIFWVTLILSGLVYTKYNGYLISDFLFEPKKIFGIKKLKKKPENKSEQSTEELSENAAPKEYLELVLSNYSDCVQIPLENDKFDIKIYFGLDPSAPADKSLINMYAISELILKAMKKCQTLNNLEVYFADEADSSDIFMSFDVSYDVLSCADTEFEYWNSKTISEITNSFYLRDIHYSKNAFCECLSEEEINEIIDPIIDRMTNHLGLFYKNAVVEYDPDFDNFKIDVNVSEADDLINGTIQNWIDFCEETKKRYSELQKGIDSADLRSDMILNVYSDGKRRKKLVSFEVHRLSHNLRDKEMTEWSKKGSQWGQNLRVAIIEALKSDQPYEENQYKNFLKR